MWGVIAVVVSISWPMLVGAQEKSESLRSDQTELLLQRQKGVMEFVRLHQPDVETALLVLEEKRPVKFVAAIKRISKTVKRLDMLKRRQPAKYELSLELWKVQSEIELLSARLANRDHSQITEPEFESLSKRLESLVNAWVDCRRQILVLERKQIQQRLDKTDSMLKMINDDREAFVQKNLRSVNRTIKKLQSEKTISKN